jgi:hypothetical protein
MFGKNLQAASSALPTTALAVGAAQVRNFDSLIYHFLLVYLTNSNVYKRNSRISRIPVISLKVLLNKEHNLLER